MEQSNRESSTSYFRDATKRAVDGVGLWILENKLTASAFAASIGVLLGVHGLFIEAPIPRDAGVFLYVADSWLTGELPYVDRIDHKPPGIYLVLAGVIALSDSSTSAVYAANALILVVNFATAFLLLELARRLWSVELGMLTAVLYLTSLTVYQGNRIQTSQFLAFWSVVAVLALYHYFEGSGGWRFAALAGLATSFTAFFKQTGLAILAGIVLYVAIREGQRAYRGEQVSIEMRDAGAFLAAFCLPVALLVGYYAAHGAVSELVFWIFTAHTQYGSSSTTISNLIGEVFEFFARFPAIWILPLAAVFLGEYNYDGESRFYRLLAILLGLSLAPLLFRRFPHYAHQALPFACLLSVFFVHSLIRGQDARARRVIGISLVMVLVIGSLPIAAAIHDKTVSAASQDMSHQEAIAEDIQTHTEPNDEILVLRAEPSIYYLADRSPVNQPNIYHNSLTQGVSYTDAGLLETVRSERPPAVVLRYGSGATPVTWEYVESEYTMVQEYGYGYALYLDVDGEGAREGKTGG